MKTESEKRGSPKPQSWIWVGPIGLAIFALGLLLGGPSLDGYLSGPYSFSIPLAVIVIGSMTFLYSKLGRSTLFLFPFVFLGVYYSLLIVNSKFDRGPATIHDVIVEKKSLIRDGDGSEFCSVAVRSWRAGRTSEQLSIRCNWYHNLIENKSHLSVETKPGFLGQEWVSDLK